MSRSRRSSVVSLSTVVALAVATLAVPVPVPAAAATETGIVFSVGDLVSEEAEMHRVDPDGSGLAPVRKGQWPAVSPDGTTIAFFYRSSYDVFGLWTVGVDGSGLRKLVDGGFTKPAWSPDGKRIAVMMDGNVWAVDVSSGEVSALTYFPVASGRTAVNLSWAPDGSEVVFALDPDGSSGQVLYGVEPDGAGDTRIIYAPSDGHVQEVDWAPDSSRIAFAGFVGGTSGLFSVKPDGTGVTTILDENESRLGLNLSYPVWSPDGSELLFVGSPFGGGSWGLWTVNANGTGAKNVVDGYSARIQPDWAGTGGSSGGGGGSTPPPAQEQDTAACPAGQVPEDGMTDVSASSPHEPSIDCVVWWGVASGKTATTYGPTGDVRRDHMAAFIARLMEKAGATLPTEDLKDYFTDDDDNPYELQINQLAAIGVVGGVTETTYAPKRGVTRGQMATFLVGTYEEITGATMTASRDHFTDDNGTHHEANINKVTEAGFASGTSATTFSPGKVVNRAQMASFLRGVLDLLVEQGYASPPSGG